MLVKIKLFNITLMFLVTRLLLFVEKAKHVKVSIAKAQVAKIASSALMIGKLVQKENVLIDVHYLDVHQDLANLVNVLIKKQVAAAHWVLHLAVKMIAGPVLDLSVLIFVSKRLVLLITTAIQKVENVKNKKFDYTFVSFILLTVKVYQICNFIRMFISISE